MDDQAKANQEYLSMALRQQQAYQPLGVGALGAAPMPPRTLASAISALDALNKRLAEVSDKALRIATMIGGPVPASGGIQGANSPEKPSAMQGLNDLVQECHNRVNALSAGLDAMSRSLGALDG